MRWIRWLRGMKKKTENGKQQQNGSWRLGTPRDTSHPKEYVLKCKRLVKKVN
jgi:hypothetical protein